MIKNFKDYHLGLLNENIGGKILDPKQLNLFDDAFSSRTMLNTLLHHFLAKEVVLTDEIYDCMEAVYYLEDGDNIESIFSLLADNGDFSDIELDASSITEYVRSISDATEYHTILKRLIREIEHDTDATAILDALTVLLDSEFKVLPLSEFVSIFSNNQLFDSYNASTEFGLAMKEANQMDSYEIIMILGEKAYNKTVSMKCKDNPNKFLSRSYVEALCRHLKHEEGMDNNTITIHRAITIPYSVERFNHQVARNSNGLGIYWSYENGGAQTHNGDVFKSGENGTGGFTVALTAEVDVQNINWKQTLYKCLYNLREELEIELKPDATVNITSYSIDCEDEKQLVRSICNYYLDLDMKPDISSTAFTALNDSSTVELDSPITVRV